MDGNELHLTSDDLYVRLGTASAPFLIDARRADAFKTDDLLIIGAIHRAQTK
jgi:hypothetical protein